MPGVRITISGFSPEPVGATDSSAVRSIRPYWPTGSTMWSSHTRGNARVIAARFSMT